jgi:hypothetical protein
MTFQNDWFAERKRPIVFFAFVVKHREGRVISSCRYILHTYSPIVLSWELNSIGCVDRNNERMLAIKQVHRGILSASTILKISLIQLQLVLRKPVCITHWFTKGCRCGCLSSSVAYHKRRKEVCSQNSSVFKGCHRNINSTRTINLHLTKEKPEVLLNAPHHLQSNG